MGFQHPTIDFSTLDDPAERGAGPIDPAPLAASPRWLVRLAGPAVSLLILGAVAWQLRAIDVRALLGLLPTRPAFWLCFGAYYLTAPAFEWLIYRRLWALPASALGALLRKQVSNELLLGYSGEVYFYVWARRRAGLVAAPFGAIKDVSILSAVSGNAFCLLMIVLAWPLLGSLDPAIDSLKLAVSIGVVLISSSAILVLRRRLFALPRADLWRIAAIHVARILVLAVLAATMWHLLLPRIALGWWLVLGALRQLLSRLPLLPNKDLVFAGAAALLVGRHGEIAEAMALMASLIMLAHICVGAALSARQLAMRN